MKKLILLLTVSLLFLTSCKIVKIEEGEAEKTATISSAQKAVDVDAYIEEKWEPLMLPEIEERKQSFETLFDAAKGDFSAAGADYGTKKGELSGDYSFIVSDSAVVKAVNTESKAGDIEIELLSPADNGGYVIKIAVGPVLKGTALRDALNCINFNEFVNQMDYAALSNALNKKGNELSVGGIDDLSSLEGKTIEFTGCFTASEGDEIMIMPVFLEVK